MTRPGRTRTSGFTLVEVLVALLVLTVVVTTSMAAFIERSRRQQQARETLLAYQALSNEAEYRRRMPFQSLEAQPAGFVSDALLLAPLKPYKAEVKVEATNPGVKNVLMTLRWADGKREARLQIVRVDTKGTGFW